MPVFDFNNTPEKGKHPECTYTTFHSEEGEATPDRPILYLDNSKRQWQHHSCGIFTNPVHRTSFEFKEEQQGGVSADILKIAVMPQNSRDVLTLLSATEEMTRLYAERPLITMSMGGTGLMSRLCGETFGSAVTFGAVGKTSAPGQIAADELAQVLELLHKNR